MKRRPMAFFLNGADEGNYAVLLRKPAVLRRLAQAAWTRRYRTVHRTVLLHAPALSGSIPYNYLISNEKTHSRGSFV